MRSSKLSKKRLSDLKALSAELSLIKAAKEPGESYHKRYQKDKEKFRRLINLEDKLERTIKTFQRNLKKRLPRLVDWQAFKAGKVKLADLELWRKERQQLQNILLKELEEAYALGIAYGEEQWRVPSKVSEQDPDFQKALRKRVAFVAQAVIKTTQDRLKAKLKTLIARKVQGQDLTDDGFNPDYPNDLDPEVIATLAAVALNASQASSISKTEIIVGIGAAMILYGMSSGAQNKTWHTVPGAEEICADLNGQTVPIDESFDSFIGPVDQPGDPHPRCYLPGTKISSGKVLAAYKAFYDGPCVEISLSNGRKLSVTSKHQIATHKGFIAAEDLSIGDNVFSATRPKRIVTQIDPDNYQSETLIENIFTAFKKSIAMRSVSVPAAAEDLNGDGKLIKGDVDIVYSDSLLRSARLPEFTKILNELALVGAGDMAGMLNSLRSLHQLSITNSRTPSSLVGCSSDSLALGGSESAHPVKHNSGTAADNDVIAEKVLFESGSSNPGLFSEFIYRFADLIAFDKVVKIRKFYYVGHVFDLMIDKYPYTIGNSIITHNCRCYLEMSTG